MSNSLLILFTSLSLFSTAFSQDASKAASEAAQLYAKSKRLGGSVYATQAIKILEPWWELTPEEVPRNILLLRAGLKQREHEFESALEDLNQLLSSDPKNAEAWLMKTTILTVTGEFELARRAALPLFALSGEVVAATAATAATAGNGHLGESYQLLMKTLAENKKPLPTNIEVWARISLAEMAERLGDPKEAEGHFQSALSLDSKEPYSLASYGAFLLAEERYQDVITTLAGQEEAFPVLWLTAARETMGKENEEWKGYFQSYQKRRKEENGAHGHAHGRQEARFQLFLRNNAHSACHAALAGWKSGQREAADSRLLLQSALADGDQRAMKMIVDWLAETKFEDARLDENLAKARQTLAQ